MQPGRVAAGRCSAFPHTLPGWAWEMRWLTFILAAILLVSGGLAEPARADNAPGLHRLHLPGGGSAGGDRSSRGPRPSTRADAGPAVKAISPKALVVTAGTSPYGDPPGGRRIAPVRFWRAVLARPVHFDVVSHHTYAFFGPFHHAASSDDAAVPDMGRITRLVAAAVKKGRALPRRTKRTWVTELSWDSSPPDPQGVPAQRHARRLEGAFYVLWRQGVDTISSGSSSATGRDPTTARRSNRGPTHVGVSPSPPRRPSASRSSPSPRRGARDTSGSGEGRPTPGGSSSSAARERSGSPPRSASAREASSTARSAGGGASSTGRGWAPRPR